MDNPEIWIPRTSLDNEFPPLWGFIRPLVKQASGVSRWCFFLLFSFQQVEKATGLRLIHLATAKYFTSLHFNRLRLVLTMFWAIFHLLCEAIANQLVLLYSAESGIWFLIFMLSCTFFTYEALMKNCSCLTVKQLTELWFCIWVPENRTV